MSKSTSWLCILFLTLGCFKESDYESIDEEKVISFITLDDMKPANGVSPAIIKARISSVASADKRQVIFKTSMGSFVAGSGDSIVVEADHNFEASAQLVSTKIGSAKVTAKAQKILTRDTIKIEFTKAFPISLTVTVDSFDIDNNFKDNVQITASLKSDDGGVPSIGHKVGFAVVDGNNMPVGAFLNDEDSASTNAEGKAVIKFSAGSISPEGYLKIKAGSFKADGSAVAGETKIYLSTL